MRPSQLTEILKMWICLSNSFLSIVSKDCPDDSLLVRARVAEHITNVFPDAKVVTIDHSDYQFRAVIKREVIKAKMAELVDGLNYDNFKNTVRSNKLHDAFARIWHVIAALQPKAPYSAYSRPGRGG
jgi:hypothetical protein